MEKTMNPKSSDEKPSGLLCPHCDAVLSQRFLRDYKHPGMPCPTCGEMLNLKLNEGTFHPGLFRDPNKP
jgi:ssDNA-binding Zn-finger/Zn-ribbon topoisomerase 1